MLDVVRLFDYQAAGWGIGVSPILIRDTKDLAGVTLSVTPGAWAEFTASLK
jgi:hypothetical protein